MVSVIMPTRDRPELLREALESVRARETGDLKFEILVGDNGTDAGSRAAAQAYGATYLKVDKAGAGAARNAGLKIAKGEFIAFLDDDDVWLDGNIAAQLAMLRADPTLDAVLGQTISTDHDLKPLTDPWPEKPGVGDALIRSMLTAYYPQLGATVVRASVVREVGLFDESLMGDQDWDWQLRIARRRKVGFTPTPGVLFRQRPPGSFDKLRTMRLGFARKVYMRHALPEWRVMGGPVGVLNGYTLSLWQYFDYFVEAAVSRAAVGEKKGARAAIFGAFRVFPGRTLFHLVARPRLRGAALRSILPVGRLGHGAA